MVPQNGWIAIDGITIPLLETFVFVLYVLAVWTVICFTGRWIQKIATRTHMTLDERLVKRMRIPLFVLLALIGFYAIVLKSPAMAGIIEPQTMDSIMAALLIAIGAWLFFNFGEAIINWYNEEVAKDRPDLATVLSTLRIVWKAFVVVIAFMMILSEFGIEIGPLIASLGIIGLAVALAFQETLSNFFAGATLVAERPIRIGDYVRLDTGEEGYVRRIGWRSAEIEELAGNTIIVPHKKLSGAVIKDYFRPTKEVAVLVNASVSYDSDLKRVEEVVVDVAKHIQSHVKGAVRDFEPFIRYNKFGDSGIEFTVILRAQEFVHQYLIKHEFIKRLHARCKREGIAIPYPKRDIYIKSIAGLAAAAAARRKEKEAAGPARRPAIAKPARKAKPKGGAKAKRGKRK